MKLKEITISRSRKWAWDYGNGVGYNISATVEGEKLEDMRKLAIESLHKLEIEEQEKCRDILGVEQLRDEIDFNEKVEKSDEVLRQHPAVSGKTAGIGSTPKSDSKTTASGHPIEKLELPKTGKYTWYKLNGGGKVRKCNNEGCPYYLKFDEDTKKYQHWKYDANTGVGTFVDDRCDFYGG